MGSVLKRCCSIDFYRCFLSAFLQKFVSNDALMSILVT